MGWAKTGDDGRFESRTIPPAPYPGRNTAAHIHLILFAPDGARYFAGDVLFEDDPLVSAAQREAARRDPVFADVRTVRREGAVEHVDVNKRAVPREKF